MVSQPIVTVRGIVYLDGKLFLQKLKHSDGNNTFWSTPGGKLDAGEDLLSGLKREMIEETNVAPDIERLLFVQQFIDDKHREYLEFFYHIKNAEEYTAVDLESTTHGMIEVAEYGFVDPKKVTVLPEALNKIDIAQHISANQPVYLMNYL